MRWSLLASLLAVGMLCGADQPGAPPVGRATSDREADLVDALIRAGRFSDALEICGRQLRDADPQSDSAAKRVIQQSQTLTARQMASDRFDPSDLAVVQKPTKDFLKSYPSHRRRLFVEAQNVRAERQAAFHSVLRAAVSPAGDASRNVTSDQLVRVTTKILTLSDRVDDARSRLDGQPGNRPLPLIADLVRLQQELQVDAVASAVMQTELFPQGTGDCIAAATKAEQAASRAIARLPADTAARREVERLKVESILRAGQLDRGEAELERLVGRFSDSVPAQVRALQIRLDIAGGRMDRAEKRLLSFYGDAPQDAPRSTEMDVARLELLLRSDRAGEVAAWLEMIERRGGAYARRRAEVMSLRHLRASGPAQQRLGIDPSIVAAQGQDWLRRGNPQRAAELLSAAAAAESDPDRAIERAGQAAAAFVSADRTVAAAQILADVALAKPSGSGAAKTHLQAVLIISSAQDADTSQQVEKMLRANLRQWPSSTVAAAARSWLQKLLLAQNRIIEAAEAATDIPVSGITEQTIQPIIERWRVAFRGAKQLSRADLGQRFQASFRPLLGSDVARRAYRVASALLLDRDALAGLPASDGDGETLIFADALIEFRQQATVTEAVRQPPQGLLADATWRLMCDGRAHPHLRVAIADLAGQWTGNADPSLEHAERLLWKGQTETAIALLGRLIDDANDSAKTIRQAAGLLASAGAPSSLREAIKLWDSLAAGTKQGSPTWHEAKLAAIGLLQQLGNKEEAYRRAKYILLTIPAMDENIRREYERIKR